ncbi:MAG: 23S rRNA (uracil(1939)-C(5))-methyltransferase RlmD, partial [Bacteroidetes bacterium HGW-Bacteroidetes-15]
KVDGKVLFVPFAVPGDLVNVQVTRLRRSFMEGFVTSYIELSPDRAKPFCEHFGVCGGCKWQYLPYTKQLEQKQKQVYDQLKRIGKIDLPEISPIIGSQKTTYYRNKLEFTFSSSRWLTREEIASGSEIERQPVLGFHVPGKFDKVFDVRECYLQPEPSNSIRLAVGKYAIENGYSFYNIRAGEGFLRNLIIRTTTKGDVMVILSVFNHDKPRIESILNHLKTKFPQVTSIMYVVNPKVNDTINDLDIFCFHGNSYIMEEMEGVKFKIGPKSFYQTNSEQAYELYKVTRDFARLTGKEMVYDLYTGTGTIANFIAKNCSKVVGVEYVPEAIEDAKVNSQINDINNTYFYAGDMKEVLSESFFSENGYPDVIILDPPRAGVHPDVIESIVKSMPHRIVYVSCNPATQARDIKLIGSNYKVTRVQPVDMFPHTHHVENVVLLERTF